jgi:hypothetical protein
MAPNRRDGPDWQRINAVRRAKLTPPTPTSQRPARAEDNIHFTDADKAFISFEFLDPMFLIYEYHKARDERIVVLLGHRYRKDGLFETAVLHGRQSYRVKLRVSAEGVYEYGREERI